MSSVSVSAGDLLTLIQNNSASCSSPTTTTGSFFVAFSCQ
jgi:hypothetical protein